MIHYLSTIKTWMNLARLTQKTEESKCNKANINIIEL